MFSSFLFLHVFILLQEGRQSSVFSPALGPAWWLCLDRGSQLRPQSWGGMPRVSSWGNQSTAHLSTSGPASPRPLALAQRPHGPRSALPGRVRGSLPRGPRLSRVGADLAPDVPRLGQHRPTVGIATIRGKAPEPQAGALAERAGIDCLRPHPAVPLTRSLLCASVY